MYSRHCFGFFASQVHRRTTRSRDLAWRARVRRWGSDLPADVPPLLYLTHRPVEPGQLRVAGEQSDPLGEGLGKQQAIEWIFV